MSDPRRKVLKETVCLLLSEVGFSSATDESIESLVEMLQSRKLKINEKKIKKLMKILFLVMSELALQTRNYAELAGRTQPVVGDVLMSLVMSGINFKDLDVSWSRKMIQTRKFFKF